MSIEQPSHTWHALLAPIPDDAVPERRPVASPEILASEAGSAIAGWDSVMLYLSAGTAGLRVLQITLDATGELLSAGDNVLFQRQERRGGRAITVYDSESIGGRFWPDGSFQGTCWHSRTEEDEEGEESTTATPSQPTEEDIANLKRLVAELLRRAPPTKPTA